MTAAQTRRVRIRVRSIVHPHRCLQVVVGVEVVVSVRTLASDAAINCQAEDSGSDGRPLRFGQGDGAEVKGENVGAGHRLSVVDVASIQGQGSSCNHLQPGDGVASGEAPDDHRSTAVSDGPIEGDVPSGVQIGSELSTVLIEGAEGLGLNGEGHEVRSFDL